MIGDTVVFSLMLHNELIRRIRIGQREIPYVVAVRESFRVANKAYKAYKGEGSFCLYNAREDRIID